MDLKIEGDWMKLMEENCGNDGVIQSTPLYTAVADTFPFPLTHKLVFFANNDDFDRSTRSRAAFLLQAMADHPRRLDDAYPTVDRETTLPYLRRCSFRLMVDNDDKDSPLHKSGKAMVKKLIILALEHGEKWKGFLEWVQRGFSGQPLVLDLIHYDKMSPDPIDRIMATELLDVIFGMINRMMDGEDEERQRGNIDE